MQRTIVRIQENFDGQSLFYLESPKTYAQAGKMYPLDSDPAHSPFVELRQGDGSPERVREAGEKLFADLSVHPAVGLALDAALQQGDYSPICFRLDDVVDADQLPWEAFRAGASGFVALDARWPIVRMRETTEETAPRAVYEFVAPVRIAVVLSAAGGTPATRAPALPQWLKIQQTLQKHLAAPNALPLELLVLTCEEQLRDTIRAANFAGVSAGLIADKEDLIGRIRDMGPNLLHFFCHGTAEETPHLQIGTYNDWEAQQEPSIALEARELRQRADKDQNVWLVTLNCCESATRAGDARSLANSLVAAGFPAALGMREAIDVETAHLLCEFFYPAAFNLIGSAAEGGSPVVIEWAAALHEARSGLVNSCAAGAVPQAAARSCKTWTIPVLYTRREPILIKRLPGGISAARKRIIDFIRVVQQQRAKAAEDYKDLPPEVLAPLLQDFDDKIKQAITQLQNTP
jgi:CHAT domain